MEGFELSPSTCMGVALGAFQCYPPCRRLGDILSVISVHTERGGRFRASGCGRLSFRLNHMNGGRAEAFWCHRLSRHIALWKYTIDPQRQTAGGRLRICEWKWKRIPTTSGTCAGKAPS
jgi:hypothetical protein